MRHTLLLMLILWPGVAAAQDADAGRKVFRKCMACHAVDADAPERAGPHLQGIIGRGIGSLPDSSYTAALRDAGDEGRIWTEEELRAFIENPRAVFPRTKMNFAGLRQEQEQKDLIAYLGTLTE